jgi:hypothetical protein
VLLVAPCILLTLATQQEINISLGSAPGQNLRVWLIMGAEQRGFGIGSPIVFSSDGDDNVLCVQTNYSFVLWAGRADSAVSCDCYARESAEVAWDLISTQANACSTE